MVRGIAVPPQKMILGRSLRARSRTSSRSTRPVSCRTPYWTARNHLPVAETGPAVGEVAAHGQRHAHDRVARLGEGQVDREVGGRARVRLHVGVVHAEQRLGPVPGDRLHRVDELLTLESAAGVALGVLVGQHAARRLDRPPTRKAPTGSAGFRDSPRACPDEPLIARLSTAGMGGMCMTDLQRPAPADAGHGGTRQAPFGTLGSGTRRVEAGWDTWPHEIILDCDPGIDDALAIAFAHGHPGIDLVGITTVAGNVGLAKTTANALAVCEYTARPRRR